MQFRQLNYIFSSFEAKTEGIVRTIKSIFLIFLLNLFLAWFAEGNHLIFYFWPYDKMQYQKMFLHEWLC